MKIQLLQTGPIQTNTYLFDCGEFLTVVDPGEEADRILAAAAKIGKSITMILLTHAHWDHIGAVAKIKETGAAVMVHESDRTVLTGSFRRGVVDFEPDVFLKDGQVLVFGNQSITVIHTPGHTPGSVCYQVDDCLFTGDTLFAGDIGRCDLPGGDFEEMKISLRKLFCMGQNLRVLPGHGKPSMLQIEKETCRYV